ncbi:MAG TPA: flagellar biosynthesis protein FlhF [Tepidisphaeraceae bacterium]|jgi:flagellar biosynthesis protein FlhF|nr:flagellar biosynthesis protein FlhF [Tepidisphaeraceae bacterium]
MNLQTFKAQTMAEALSQVKTAMGHDAVILHTRTFVTRQWLGLRRREMVEITAGKGLNVGERSARRAAQTPRVATTVGAGTYSRQTLLNGPAAVLATARAPETSPRQNFLDSPAAGNAAIHGITQDMGSLKAMVADLVKQTRAAGAPQVPEDLLEYYTQMVGNQVAEELAADVLKTIQRQSRPEMLQNGEFVREKIAEQLEKLIPTSGGIRRTKTVGPHIVALIGPTGVGKTTTLAKLAANLKLRERHKVGLITLDTYRIAAVDQLRKYADIIGSPLRVVSTGDELREAIASMDDCEYILIDTAGRSPRDAMKLNELKGLLAVAEPDEVHLVLTATASADSVQMAITKFSEVRVDKIIFTKLDEAAHVGVVLNAVRKVNKGLSYITTGQDVPDDIEVGRGRRLAQMILGN